MSYTSLKRSAESMWSAIRGGAQNTVADDVATTAQGAGTTNGLAPGSSSSMATRAAPRVAVSRLLGRDREEVELKIGMTLFDLPVPTERRRFLSGRRDSDGH